MAMVLNENDLEDVRKVADGLVETHGERIAYNQALEHKWTAPMGTFKFIFWDAVLRILIARVLKDERGASVEHALLLMLIAAVIVGAVSLLGSQLKNLFDQVIQSLNF